MKYIFLSITFLLSLEAYSEHVDHSYKTCSTQSNGYTFSKKSRVSRVANILVLEECRGHGSTSNRACNANITCSDDKRVKPFVTCSTSSNN